MNVEKIEQIIEDTLTPDINNLLSQTSQIKIHK